MTVCNDRSACSMLLLDQSFATAQPRESLIWSLLVYENLRVRMDYRWAPVTHSSRLIVPVRVPPTKALFVFRPGVYRKNKST